MGGYSTKLASPWLRAGAAVPIALAALAAVAIGTSEARSTAVTLPFTDTFSAADGSELADSWIDRRGNITVLANSAAGTGGKVNLATLDGVNQAGVVVMADVTLGAGKSAGLVARYSGPEERMFYLGTLSRAGAGFRATIWKNVGGANKKLATGTKVGVGTGTLQFRVVGPSLKLFFNGQLVAFAQDVSLTSGSVGIRLERNAALDNFAAASAGAVAGLPFSDTFTSAVNAQLGDEWIEQRGNMTVAGGVATGTGARENLATLNGVNAANVQVSVPISLAARQTVGLVGRYAGPLKRNFYLGRLAAAGAGFRPTIWKNVDGKNIKLATGPTLGTATGTLQFVLAGSTLTLKLDGTVLATVTDSSFAAAGSVGMSLGRGVSVTSFGAE